MVTARQRTLGKCAFSSDCGRHKYCVAGTCVARERSKAFSKPTRVLDNSNLRDVAATRRAAEKEKRDRLALAKKLRAESERMQKENEARKARLRKKLGRWATSMKGYKIPWTKRPGDPGFNAYATQKMVDDGLPLTLRLDCMKPGCDPTPMAYQNTVAYLVQSHTHVERLLCVHRTGSGKTYTMAMVLDNFFDDPRPKVLIFPTGAVANNFYSEVLKFDSKYRDFIHQRLGKNPSLKAVEDLLAMKGKLRRAGKVGELAAPLRAYSYARAGGSTYFKANKTGYNGRIVCMDEAHNLVHVTKEMNRFKKQLARLRDALHDATDSVVVGFTATPVVTDAKDGEALLKVIKGKANAGRSDEGFVSYYYSMPTQIYPLVLQGADGKLARTISVPLPDALAKNYKKKTKKGVDCEKDIASCARMQNYANTEGFYASFANPKSAQSVKFAKAFDDNPAVVAPKFAELLARIKVNRVKTLILVERHAGFKAVRNLMEADNRLCALNGGTCMGSVYDKKGSGAVLKRFNAPDNLRGEKMMYMLVDAKEFSEGVSFFGVRQMYLLNPPLAYGRYEQQIGRVLRSCGYDNLPRNERNVMISMLVGKFGAGHPTCVDELGVKRLQKEQASWTHSMDRFRKVAVDRAVLDRYFKDVQ